jgi:hypothetical protein
MIKILKSQEGSSLLQVTVAFGLMGVLSLALTKMNIENMKANKRIESKAEISSINREISSFVGDYTSCANTFGGVGTNLNTLKTTGSMTLTEIRDASDNVRFSNTTKRMGVSISGIEVNSYNLVNNSASLDVEYEYTLGNTNMKRTRRTTISFEFDSTNTNELSRCVARSNLQNIDLCIKYVT